MSISTTKPIASVTYNGTEIALKSGEKEVWVLKETIDDAPINLPTSFTSNGIQFSNLASSGGELAAVSYDETYVYAVQDANLDFVGWLDPAYRKLIFDTAPTGDLLTWLEANGVKQTANLAVQESKSVTITANGTTTIAADAPYDGVAQVLAQVNVPADFKVISIGADSALVSAKSYTLTHNLGRKPKFVGLTRTSMPSTGSSIFNFMIWESSSGVEICMLLGNSSSVSAQRRSSYSASEIPSEGFVGQAYYTQVGNANESTVDFKFGETSNVAADLSSVFFIVF